MKVKGIVCTALVASLGIGTAAQARDGWRDGRHERNHERRHEQRYEHRHHRVQPSYVPQYRSYGYAPQYRSYERGPVYRSSYAPRYWAGGYVPHHYRAQRYWVNDWRARQLYAPPYGYQWVQTDTGDVLLMALATGLIASVILAQ